MTGEASDTVPPTAGPLTLREPVIDDGHRIHALVRATGALDLNSTYCYLLLSSHFAGTCAVAARNGDVLGAVLGYCKPQQPETLFIWQVGVHPSARGQGIGRRLLHYVLDQPGCGDVRFLEATVTPDNDASWALFSAVARDRGAALTHGPGFDPAHFGGQSHEPEALLRIGPLAATATTRE